MNIDAIREILKRVTYKPGWRFEVFTEPYDLYHGHEIVLGLVYDADDADGRRGRASVFSRRSFPREVLLDENGVLNCLFALIDQAERHERDEWLRVDGVHVNDPHPEQKEMRRKIISDLERRHEYDVMDALKYATAGLDYYVSDEERRRRLYGNF